MVFASLALKESMPDVASTRSKVDNRGSEKLCNIIDGYPPRDRVDVARLPDPFLWSPFVIPMFNASMVLPPFVGDNPGIKASMSPYKAQISDVVKRFATSSDRLILLQGLLLYRHALRQCGVLDGFQWLDGSFVDDVEKVRNRAPADIDLVTFASRPAASDGPGMQQWVAANGALFDPQQTKVKFACDAFFIDLRKPPDLLVQDTSYWFGLFSHQRATSRWKGMIQVPMQSDDADASKFLAVV